MKMCLAGVMVSLVAFASAAHADEQQDRDARIAAQKVIATLEQSQASGLADRTSTLRFLGIVYEAQLLCKYRLNVPAYVIVLSRFVVTADDKRIVRLAKLTYVETPLDIVRRAALCGFMGYVFGPIIKAKR